MDELPKADRGMTTLCIDPERRSACRISSTKNEIALTVGLKS